METNELNLYGTENTAQAEEQPKEPAGEKAPRTAERASAAPKSAKKAADDRPTRRIGSWTLGFALIACGVCLMLYYFAPSFDFVLAAKLSPLLLIALGIEVLFYAAKPGRGKYDFLSVFVCLCLMGGCFCLSLLPAAWYYIGPERQHTEQLVSSQIEDSLYQRLKGGDVSELYASVNLDYDNRRADKAALDGTEYLEINVTLGGSYASKKEFAAAARRVLDAVQAEQLSPWSLQVVAGSEQCRYTLDLNSPYEMDYSAAQLAEITVSNGTEESDTGESDTGESNTGESDPQAGDLEANVPADSSVGEAA